LASVRRSRACSLKNAARSVEKEDQTSFFRDLVTFALKIGGRLLPGCASGLIVDIFMSSIQPETCINARKTHRSSPQKNAGTCRYAQVRGNLALEAASQRPIQS